MRWRQTTRLCCARECLFVLCLPFYTPPLACSTNSNYTGPCTTLHEHGPQGTQESRHVHRPQPRRAHASRLRIVGLEHKICEKTMEDNKFLYLRDGAVVNHQEGTGRAQGRQ